MNTKSTISKIAALLLIIIVSFAGCTKDSNPAQPASFSTDSRVFLDEFAPNVTYQAFSGSVLDAVQKDASQSYAGTHSLIARVPDYGDSAGSYAGGAFTSYVPRDLTQYNALTFWAKSSVASTLDVAGIGNDNTGTSRFTAEVNDLAISTGWNYYVIPIPLSSKLSAEEGLFYFAEGPENGTGFNLWFDEVQFETLGTISNPQPTIPTETKDVYLGDTIKIDGGSVIFDVDGSPVTVSAMPGYFTFLSSNNAVVKVAENGVISAEGIGSVELTAMLGTVPASGAITVNVADLPDVPNTPAPTPTTPAVDVVSIFSNAYTNEPVTTWSAEWDDADVVDETIDGDDVKKYENLVIGAIEFTNPTIDASAMTHFHIDLWTPNMTDAPAVFKIKLVDFGADGIYGGGDDVEHELTFDHTYLKTGEWFSIDLPLSSFSGLFTKGHLAQLIISGALSIVYVDNIYLYDAKIPMAPTTAAPTPTLPAGSVISLFSDAYTDVPIDTWSADWDSADVEDVVIDSDNMKKYTNVLFAGIEFTSNTIDASSMTHFHMDVWTPDATNAPSVLKVKIVDFGANGVWDGGGDDVEHELTFDESVMKTGEWVSLEVPFIAMYNLSTRAHLAQLIISGDPNTIFIDNVYLHY